MTIARPTFDNIVFPQHAGRQLCRRDLWPIAADIVEVLLPHLTTLAICDQQGTTKGRAACDLSLLVLSNVKPIGFHISVLTFHLYYNVRARRKGWKTHLLKHINTCPQRETAQINSIYAKLLTFWQSTIFHLTHITNTHFLNK